MAAKDEKKTLVKVCGVTTPEDATQAASAGADFIGMILWPKSKRSIPLDVAKQVADAAKAAGATPIGVFVDESAEEIVAACEAVGIDHAQLHGDNARAALTDLPMKIKAVYVVSAAKDGAIVTPMPGDEEKLCEDRPDQALGAGGLEGGDRLGQRAEAHDRLAPRRRRRRGVGRDVRLDQPASSSRVQQEGLDPRRGFGPRAFRTHWIV